MYTCVYILISIFICHLLPPPWNPGLGQRHRLLRRHQRLREVRPLAAGLGAPAAAAPRQAMAVAIRYNW